MTDQEFLKLTITAFLIVVASSIVGLVVFLRWRRSIVENPPTPEQMAKRAALIDARYRRKHPELDEDFEPTKSDGAE